MTITEVKYYYYRDQHRAPRVTLCRVRDDLGRYGYGWSICTDPSPHPGDRIQDGELIRGGRSIARGRAEASLTPRRGIACFIKADGVVCRLYWRPIRRREALEVIRTCPEAFGLLACIKERDILWFPETMRPPAVPIDAILRFGSQIPSKQLSKAWSAAAAANKVAAAQLEFQKDVERRLSKAIRAGGDANELARLEMLGAVDAAGYLTEVDVNALARQKALQHLDTLQEAEARKVYSEALERFVPGSEAL